MPRSPSHDDQGSGRFDRPSIARVYDALLGGTANAQVDRDVRDQLLAVAPELGRLAWDNRQFLSRVTRFLAGQAGIDQFIDCGSGLPTAENTHQVAQRENNDAVIVYVDRDPDVVSYGSSLVAKTGRIHMAEADFSDPAAVLEHEVVRTYIDFSRPVGFYHLGSLHHLADDQDPASIMRENIAALAPGSYVAISHFYHPGAEDPTHTELAERLEAQFLGSAMGTGRFRTREEILGYFHDLELVPPGLVVVSDWWPDGPRVHDRDPAQWLMLGGVGMKPRPRLVRS